MRNFAQYNLLLLKKYEQWMVAMHYVKHTQDHYRKALREFVKFLGEKSAATVTHWDIRDFIVRISEDGASLDKTYRYLGVVRLFYDFLNLGGVVSYVAPRLVRLRRPLENGGPFLTESQVQRLIAATRTLRERALIELFYGTGCRLAEARHLKVEDIDLIGRTARITGKFGKVRNALLTKNAVEALRTYIGDRPSGFVFQKDMPIQKGSLGKKEDYWVGQWINYGSAGPPYRRESQSLGRVDVVPYEEARERFRKTLGNVNLVRPQSSGPLSRMAVQVMLEHIGERAGLKNVGPHMLRRSFATHLLDHGASLDVIQALMGHVYLQTTVRYTRLSTGRLVKTFERCHPRGKMNERRIAETSQQTAKIRQGDETSTEV